MGTMASEITSLPIVSSTVYLGADQRKHQSSASLAFVRGIHRWPVNSPHKRPVTRKMFPDDDVIMDNKVWLLCMIRGIYYWHWYVIRHGKSPRGRSIVSTLLSQIKNTSDVLFTVSDHGMVPIQCRIRCHIRSHNVSKARCLFNFFPLALEIGRRSNTAAEPPAKFERDTNILTPNSAGFET